MKKFGLTNEELANAAAGVIMTGMALHHESDNEEVKALAAMLCATAEEIISIILPGTEMRFEPVSGKLYFFKRSETPTAPKRRKRTTSTNR